MIEEIWILLSTPLIKRIVSVLAVIIAIYFGYRRIQRQNVRRASTTPRRLNPQASSQSLQPNIAQSNQHESKTTGNIARYLTNFASTKPAVCIATPIIVSDVNSEIVISDNDISILQALAKNCQLFLITKCPPNNSISSNSNASSNITNSSTNNSNTNNNTNGSTNSNKNDSNSNSGGNNSSSNTVQYSVIQENLMKAVEKSGLLQAGLKPHHLLFYTTSIGKGDIIRHLKPNLYIDDEIEVIETVGPHIAGDVCLISAKSTTTTANIKAFHCQSSLSRLFSS